MKYAATHTGTPREAASGKVPRPVQPATLNRVSNAVPSRATTSSTSYRPGMDNDDDGDGPPAVPRTKNPRHNRNESPQNTTAASEKTEKAPRPFQPTTLTVLHPADMKKGAHNGLSSPTRRISREPSDGLISRPQPEINFVPTGTDYRETEPSTVPPCTNHRDSPSSSGAFPKDKYAYANARRTRGHEEQMSSEARTRNENQLYNQEGDLEQAIAASTDIALTPGAVRVGGGPQDDEETLATLPRPEQSSLAAPRQSDLSTGVIAEAELVVDEEQATTRSNDKPPVIPATEAPWWSRRRNMYILVGVIVALLVILGAVVGYILASRDNSSDPTTPEPVTDESIGSAADLWREDRSKAEEKYGPISEWDTSGVTDMSGLFENDESFNENIGGWDTSQVRNFSNMFKGASSFNQALGGWDTSSANNMSGMFNGASSFDQDVSNFDTGSVSDMSSMFEGASAFDQDVSGFDTNTVRDTSSMFAGADSFNGDMSGWETSNVETMAQMFARASAFDQDVSHFNTEKVRNMSSMFEGAGSFNGGMRRTDASNVKMIAQGFGDMSTWDTSNVETMVKMFRGALAFDQSLCWDLSSIQEGGVDSMFEGSQGCFNASCVDEVLIEESDSSEVCLERGTPEPTPEETTPEPTPEETTPEPTPEETTPEPTPEETTPEPTPEETTPEPTPEETTPEPTPEETTPEPTPEETTPEPTPEETTPEPTPPPPPTNDRCADAISLSVPASVQDTTLFASVDEDTPSCNVLVTAPGVWYTVQGTGGRMTAHTCSSSTDFDTKITVFQGSSCFSLSCIGGNDDSDSCTRRLLEQTQHRQLQAPVSTKSSISWDSTVGQEYRILVHGFQSQAGTFVLQITSGPAPEPPSNDRCVNAVWLGTYEVIESTTLLASVDADTPTCDVLVTAPSVWYRVSGTGGRMTADTCSSSTDFDTKITVFQGSSCSGLSCIGGNDDSDSCTRRLLDKSQHRQLQAPVATKSSISWDSIVGQEYKILVHGFGDQAGTFVLQMTTTGPPTPPPSADGATCTLRNDVDACTNPRGDINLGTGLSGSECRDQCEAEMSDDGCWVLATNGYCYCREGGELSTEGPTNEAGGRCTTQAVSCTLRNDVDWCTSPRGEINLGTGLSGSECRDQCEVMMSNDGCWVLAGNGICYCREGGELGTGGPEGIEAGGRCSSPQSQICTLRNDADYCTSPNGEINLGSGLSGTECRDECESEMSSAGCWIVPENGICYCREGGELGTGGPEGVNPGGTCS